MPDTQLQPAAWEPSPFASLLTPPVDRGHYGANDGPGPRPPGHADAAVAVGDIEFFVGNRPKCRNVRALYERTGRSVPNEWGIYDAYDLWLVTHSLSVQKRGGSWWDRVAAIGYQVDLGEELAQTLQLLPDTRFIKVAGVHVGGTVSADLSAAGEWAASSTAMPLGLGERWEAGAKFEVSPAAGMTGRVTFNVMSPRVIATGVNHSRCEWRIDLDDKPLLGEQVLFQTLLVPKGERHLDVTVRGYAFIRTGYTFFSVPHYTQWVPVRLQLA